MAHRPEIFISSTTADLGTARQAISDALVMSGCRPITQQISTPDAAGAREAIKSRLSDCDGVIHIAGLHYGEEPTERGLTEARRSYVQLEYEVAKELQKSIYVFVCADGYSYDKGEPEPPELQDLQRDHRNRLLSSGLPFTLVNSPTELYQQITDLPLRETEAAKPPDVDEVERNRIRRLSFNVALALALVVAGFAGLNWLGDREIAKPLPTPTPVATPVIVKATPTPAPKIVAVTTPTPAPASPVPVATPATVAVATPMIATPLAVTTPVPTPKKPLSTEPVVMTPRATPEPNETREELVDSKFAEEPAMRDEIVRAYEKEASNPQGSARLRKLLQAYRDKLRAAGVEDWEITLRLMSAARGNTTMSAPVISDVPEPLPAATPKPVATPAKTTPRPTSTPAPAAPKATPAATPATKKTTAATPTPTPKPRPVASPTPKPKSPATDSATPRPKPKAPAADEATPKPKPKPSASDDATPKPKPKTTSSDDATPRPKPKPSASDDATPKPKPKVNADSDATPKPKPKPSSTPKPKPKPQPEV